MSGNQRTGTPKMLRIRSNLADANCVANCTRVQDHSLLFAGLVTSEAVSVLGAIVSVAGAVGWFRDVFAAGGLHESLPMEQPAPSVTTTRREVARIDYAHELHRAWLPVEIQPISAGVKGGLAGSVAMAVLAMLYGILNQHSIWYPINLLAANAPLPPVAPTTAEIAAFQLRHFLIAVSIHLITSLLVGLLYGTPSADASTATGSAGMTSSRPFCGAGLDLRNSRHREPGDEPAHRLAVVCGFAGGIRDRRGFRRFPARARTHVAAHAARRPLES